MRETALNGEAGICLCPKRGKPKTNGFEEANQFRKQVSLMELIKSGEAGI